jgi:anti-sigma B factor antagonist
MQVRDHVDDDGIHIVELSGEVDLHHAVELREILTAHADAKRPALVVDFTEVSYIDSAGLATLIEYVQRSMGYGGKFALGGVSQRLRTVFDIARLDQVFAIHPTLAEAKATLGS